MATFYHGSDRELTELRAGSYITPDPRVASWFGRVVYRVDAEPDKQVWKHVGWCPMPIYDGLEVGTCTQVYRDREEGWDYAMTHVALPVVFFQQA